MPMLLYGNGTISGATTLAGSVSIAGTANVSQGLTTASRGISNSSVPSGSVIQVVSSLITSTTTTSSSSYVATNVNLSITPTYNTSKILVLISGCYFITRGAVSTTYGDAYFKIVRNSAIDLTTQRVSINFGVTTWTDHMGSVTLNYLDSPATTSATNYKVYVNTAALTQLLYPSSDANITLMEIAQ